jgi:hypothetical protein
MTRRRLLLLLVGAVGSTTVTACGSGSATTAPAPVPYPRDGVLRVDDIQVVGTHNRDHLRPPGTLPLGDVAD